MFNQLLQRFSEVDVAQWVYRLS